MLDHNSSGRGKHRAHRGPDAASPEIRDAGSTAAGKKYHEPEGAERRVSHVGDRNSADAYLESQTGSGWMTPRYRRAVAVICLICLLITFISSFIWTRYRLVTLRQEVGTKTENLSSELQAALNDAEWEANFLGLLMRNTSVSPDGNQEELDTVIDHLEPADSPVSSIAITAGDEISYSYSFMGESEDYLTDLMTLSGARRCMNQARRDRSSCLSDLTQDSSGKKHYVLYVPLFRSESDRTTDRFIVLFLDYTLLFDQSSLDALIQGDGCSVVIQKIEDSGALTRIFSTSDRTPGNPVTVDFKLSNQIWHIEAAPENGWLMPEIIMICIILPFLICAIVIIFSILFLHIHAERESAEYFAMYDSLTGVQNRQALRTEFRQLATSGDMMFVMLIDLDNFKSVNDIHGHSAGDICLANVGQALSRYFPRNSCFRYGGDEFLVIASDKNLRSFQKKVDDFRSCYHELATRSGVITTLSAGFVYGTCSSMEDLRKMISQADVCLYEIKKGSKGHSQSKPYDPDAVYQDFEKQNEDDQKKKHYIVDSIRTALSSGWISVVYQPIIRSLTGQLAGVEALVRWNDPDRGFVRTEEFIPVLEQAYLITDLDLYVIEQVCRDYVEERNGHYPQIPTSVNISFVDLRDPTFIEQVNAIVDKYKVPHRHLSFEIKEHPNITGDLLRERTQELKNLDYRVWLDDFGSSSSSLSGLLSLPVELVKLDMNFLNDLVSNANDREYVEAMISMLKELHVQVLAERVENDFEKDLLISSGCGLLQGYCCGRPVSENSLISQWLSVPHRVENTDSHNYYRTISQVNILHPVISSPVNLEYPYSGNLPMCIMEIRNMSSIRILSENEAHIAARRSDNSHRSQPFGSDFYGEEAFRQRFFKAATYCLAHPDSWQNMDFISPGAHYCIGRVHYLATDPSTDTTAYEFVMIDLDACSQVGQKLSALSPDSAGSPDLVITRRGS